jgi:hypothetical protein
VDDIEGLEQARLLPQRGDHSDDDLSRALKTLVRLLRCEPDRYA